MATLTTKTIRRAKPRKKRYEISCSQTRGLLLRVLPSGKKVLLCRQRANGRDTKVRLGLFGDGQGNTITLDEAREQVARLAVLGTATQAPPAIAEDSEPPSCCFSELVAAFLARHVETDALRESTRKNYRKALADFLLVWGPRSLDSIRFADVEEWHRSNSHRPSAANNYIRVLHLAFKKAGQWEMFDRRNPAEGIKLFKETKRKRYLSAAERERLDTVLDNALHRWTDDRSHRSGPWARWSHVYAIRLLLLTGMRMGEVLALEWSWISAPRLEVVLPDSKTGQSVRPISPAVLDLLEELQPYQKAGVPLVVYGQNDQQIDPASLRSAWSRLRRAAGIDDVRLHDLRHSAASDALSAGCTLAEVGVILGHKRPSTTARYAHLSPSAGRAAAKRMTDSIMRKKKKRKR